MVQYDDMTENERERFIYLTLSENDLTAIIHILKKKLGRFATTDEVMRFAFKVAVNRMTPNHLKKKNKL
jgi:hypothetical protein